MNFIIVLINIPALALTIQSVQAVKPSNHQPYIGHNSPIITYWWLGHVHPLRGLSYKLIHQKLNNQLIKIITN